MQHSTNGTSKPRHLSIWVSELNYFTIWHLTQQQAHNECHDLHLKDNILNRLFCDVQICNNSQIICLDIMPMESAYFYRGYVLPLLKSTAFHWILRFMTDFHQGQSGKVNETETDFMEELLAPDTKFYGKQKPQRITSLAEVTTV